MDKNVVSVSVAIVLLLSAIIYIQRDTTEAKNEAAEAMSHSIELIAAELLTLDAAITANTLRSNDAQVLRERLIEQLVEIKEVSAAIRTSSATPSQQLMLHNSLARLQTILEGSVDTLHAIDALADTTVSTTTHNLYTTAIETIKELAYSNNVGIDKYSPLFMRLNKEAGHTKDYVLNTYEAEHATTTATDDTERDSGEVETGADSTEIPTNLEHETSEYELLHL